MDDDIINEGEEGNEMIDTETATTNRFQDSTRSRWV